MDVKPQTPSPQDEPLPRSKLSRRKIWVFRLLALAMGLLLGFIALEVGVRILASARPDDIETLKRFEERKAKGEPLDLRHLIRMSRNPLLIYEFIPSVEGIFERVTVRINSAGYRDKERTLAKPPNTWRLATLGDSILFGWGADEEVRFTNVLEKFLNDTGDGTTFEVLNFGVPSYNTVSEAGLLKSVVAPYEPDAILLSFCLENDHSLPNFVSRPRPLFTLRESFFLKLLQGRGKGGIRGRLQPELEGSKRDVVPEEYRFMVGVDNCLKALVEIGDYARRKKWPALFVLDYWLLDPYLPPNNRPFSDDPGTTVTTAARAAGFIEVNTLKPTADYLTSHSEGMRAMWVTNDDPHPNAIRHALVAREIYRQMVEQGVLPDSAARRAELDAHLARWDEIIKAARARTTFPSRAGEVGNESLDYSEVWGRLAW